MWTYKLLHLLEYVRSKNEMYFDGRLSLSIPTFVDVS
jgi:hypothetical protein